ncbi:uncharacterized protein LOC128200205 [Galleria mellonella]|uniref:Uncharacterized protein LOC128200205 n=1 Tax=Galleria mellonella TaxID=7137 RepID=A0ABM3MBL4_GALME|nr:uncharacterized protein LOC128200205 [Galleria mellonella]
MAIKFTILLTTFALSQAVPIQIFADGVAVSSGGLPQRPIVSPPIPQPNVAFGFGSGFSSDIAGVRHSTGISSSFSTGDSQAYGSGVGSTGNTYAKGASLTNGAPSTYYVRPAGRQYNIHAENPQYTASAASAAQVQGQNDGWVQNYRPVNQYQSAVSSAQNSNQQQSAVSAAQNQQGLGYQSAVSAAHNGRNYGSAVSNAQSHNGYSNFGSAISAAQNIGGLKASTAQAVQHHGAGVQHSGASSLNAPGIQSAQSHAINTGYY